MQEFNDEFLLIVENENWVALANLTLSFKINIHENGFESRRLKKKLTHIRYLLHENLKNYENASSFYKARLFVAMVKAIKSIEDDFNKNKIEKREFLNFLKVVLHKLKKERLKIEKPFERKFEFKKMKDAIENGLGKTI
ncbi:MAG: hypothetical protein AABX38_03680 [Candidatus Micrarchaeota archaeon]